MKDTLKSNYIKFNQPEYEKGSSVLLSALLKKASRYELALATLSDPKAMAHVRQALNTDAGSPNPC